MSGLERPPLMPQSTDPRAPKRGFVFHKRILRAVSVTLCVGLAAILLSIGCLAQTNFPFQVANPKHQPWPADEAARIYESACELAARAIRPEQPPRLRPKFILVLGANNNETVRYGEMSELRLKKWEPAKFAQAVVVMAVREVLPGDQIANMVRTAVLSSQATISAKDLRQGH
jgi:hypothetical protein